MNMINMNGKQKELNLDLDVYEILQPIIGLNSPACPNLGYETSPEMTSTTRGVLMKVHSLKADLRPMEGHCLDFRDTQSPVDTKSSTRDEESILQMIRPGSCQSLYTHPPICQYTHGPQNESRVLFG